MILPEHLSKRNQKIIDRYGLQDQLLQLQEECAELIQAASKYRRATGKEKLGVAEHDLELEMVDVAIVMDQIMERIGMTMENLDLMATYKIDRTIGRM